MAILERMAFPKCLSSLYCSDPHVMSADSPYSHFPFGLEPIQVGLSRAPRYVQGYSHHFRCHWPFLFGEILEDSLVDFQLIPLSIDEADPSMNLKLAVGVSLGEALRLFTVNGVPCDGAEDS